MQANSGQLITIKALQQLERSVILQLHKHASISLCACITVMFLTSAGMAAWSSTEMPIMPHVSKGIHITYSKTTHALALPKAEVNRMVSAAQAMKGPEVIKQFVNGAKSRVKKVSVPVIDISFVRLAYLQGCGSGGGNYVLRGNPISIDSSLSISQCFVNRGADAVVGFYNFCWPHREEYKKFSRQFWHAMYRGDTVEEAVVSGMQGLPRKKNIDAHDKYIPQPKLFGDYSISIIPAKTGN